MMTLKALKKNQTGSPSPNPALWVGCDRAHMGVPSKVRLRSTATPSPRIGHPAGKTVRALVLAQFVLGHQHQGLTRR